VKSEKWQQLTGVVSSEMAAAEFESLGMTRREARRLVRRRLGGRASHRRAALRELRADFRALFDLLPRHRIRKSPILVPTVIAAAIVLMLAFNPQRRQAIESLRGILPFLAPANVARWIPLTPRGVVPTGFASATLWSFALVAIARMASTPALRAHWRLSVFGGITLLMLIAFGAVFWATTLQVLLANQWTNGRGQGMALLAFLFCYVAWAFHSLRFWFGDLQRRCPVCLRQLGMPEVRGNAHDVLLAPLETETVCLHGHGLNLESHWGRVFAPDDLRF